MVQSVFSFTARLAAIALFIASLSACTVAPDIAQSDSLIQAYNAPGVMQVAPYTRTIFSSHNF